MHRGATLNSASVGDGVGIDEGSVGDELASVGGVGVGVGAEDGDAVGVVGDELPSVGGVGGAGVGDEDGSTSKLSGTCQLFEEQGLASFAHQFTGTASSNVRTRPDARHISGNASRSQSSNLKDKACPK